MIKVWQVKITFFRKARNNKYFRDGLQWEMREICVTQPKNLFVQTKRKM